MLSQTIWITSGLTDAGAEDDCGLRHRHDTAILQQCFCCSVKAHSNVLPYRIVPATVSNGFQGQTQHFQTVSANVSNLQHLICGIQRSLTITGCEILTHYDLHRQISPRYTLYSVSIFRMHNMFLRCLPVPVTLVQRANHIPEHFLHDLRYGFD